MRILILETGAAESSLIAARFRAAGTDVRLETAAEEASFTDALRRFKPEVVVSGWGSGFGAHDAFALVRRMLPGTAFILVTSAIDDQEAVAFIRKADAVVLKQSMDAALIAAVDGAVGRRRPLRKLSPRQIEVLRLVAEGRNTREIAEGLGLSMKTVESHRGAVMKRLAKHNVAELVRYAVENGIVV